MLCLLGMKVRGLVQQERQIHHEYFDAAILTNPTGTGALNIFLEGVSSLNKTQMDGRFINVDVFL